MSTTRHASFRAASLRGFGPYLIGLALVATVVGCSRSNVSSPQGDRTAAQRAAAAETRKDQPQAGSAARPQVAAPLLRGSDLTDVYQLILQQYVERVDYAGLIEAARGGLRESLVDGGGAPADVVPLDILPLATGSAEKDWQSFGQVYDGVIQRRPELSRESRPDYAAARSMLGALDDSHATFQTAEEVRRRAETSYSGVGVRLTRVEAQGVPVVVEVFQGGPASVAGMRVGDRIVGVGERDTRALPLNDVVDLIRGPQGSEVSLLIERSAAGNPFAVRAFRRALTVDQANGAVVEPRIGYIKIWAFNELVPDRVGRLLLEQTGAGVQGWIVDLRHNPGGDLQAVQRVAGFFIEQRPLGITVDRAGQRQALFADRRGFAPRITPKLVVLTGRESGSGSELLAAALREYGIATLVGERTAGSVGIARSIQLADGSIASVTMLKLLSPNGTPLDRVGVEPDVTIPMTVKDLEEGRDPQLQRGIEILRQQVAGRV